MPSDLTEILFLILNDVCLIESFKPIESTFLTILSSLDKTLHDIHALSNEICDSMRCSCEFMMKYDHMVILEPDLNPNRILLSIL